MDVPAMLAVLAEVDAVTDAVRAGGPPPAMLGVLFAPTGPLQEVAISSGWAITSSPSPSAATLY
jgi:hypothetical protein